MASRRGKNSSGWAAFDLEQRRKQGLESFAEAEPYPSLLTSVTPLDHSKKLSAKKNGSNVLLEKPFVSVLLHAVDFPALMVDKKDTVDTRIELGNSSSRDGVNFANKSRAELSIAQDTVETRIQLGDSSSRDGVNFANKSHEELSVVQATEKLEERYPWADRSLIEDVLAGVNNSFDEASSMLKAMEPSNEDKSEAYDEELKENTLLVSKDVTSLKSVDFADMRSVIEEYDEHKNKELLDEHVFHGNMLDPNITLGNMKFYPIEPEWEEEDDVYLVHRKDAMRMMRSAAHHSKAASDAYARGDHLSAQQYSRKAREEWVAAERLNEEAAKEILSLRNGKNDLWTLDLHGLHAAEAIQALQKHLQKTESTISGKPLSVFLDSSSFNEGMKGNELMPSSRKSTHLQVITGKGNHSRGQAALPAAVRSFLNENGYHYDDTRPGVITVRPKFRRG